MRVSSGQRMDEATRAALASGRADPSVSLFLDTLIAMRGISRSEGEAIAGAALETEVPAPMSPNALDMAFAAIERGARKPKAQLVYPELAVAPPVLQEAMLAAEASHGWRFYGPGISRLPLRLGGRAKAEILRIEPGVAVPWHSHKGSELTLCLFGEYTDRDVAYGPGDFTIADASVRHQPTAHAAGPVYAFAVTDVGLRFEGFLGALQKLLGF
jgi:putative transcriptional regulator